MENVTSLTGSVSSSPWTLFLAHTLQAHSDLRAFVLTILYLSFSYLHFHVTLILM